MAGMGNTRGRRLTSNDAIRTATLSLVSEGTATLAEAANLAGVDRQLIRYWANFAGYDPEAREKLLAKEYRKRLKAAEKSS